MLSVSCYQLNKIVSLIALSFYGPLTNNYNPLPMPLSLSLPTVAAGEAEGGDSGHSYCGVWLGLYSAHRHPGQHDEWRACRPFWEAQHRWPDHVNQQHQPGGAASRHLSGNHQGVQRGWAVTVGTGMDLGLPMNPSVILSSWLLRVSGLGLLKTTGQSIKWLWIMIFLLLETQCNNTVNLVWGTELFNHMFCLFPSGSEKSGAGEVEHC